MSARSAYEELDEENKALKARIAVLEKASKKKRKRGPNAYQIEWKKQYPIEVVHAKSENAVSPDEEWLLPYSKRYSDDMTTAPNPKNGEPLSKTDRSVFMKNISARAKRQLPPSSPTGANKSDESSSPPSPRGVEEVWE